MTPKRFFVSAVSLIVLLAMLFALPTIIVDPFFHYHAPIDGVSYLLSEQRYQNDGILKNCSYDAVIIGSSMTECFKTSEFDALFGTNSIKVAFKGAYLKELGERLRAGFESGNDIKYVVMGLDFRLLGADKDYDSYDNYPTYLYDDNIFNDVNYLLNKSVLTSYTAENLLRTAKGVPPTSFDEYSNWTDRYKYGAEAVEKKYNQTDTTETPREYCEFDFERTQASLAQNLLPVIRENRDTTFYFFVPPYSIVKLYTCVEGGAFDYWFDVCEQGVRMLLAEENVRVFSVFDNYELVCDLDNYRDITHYGGWVNSYILECMYEGKHELHTDTLTEHFDAVKEYYKGYDYSMFEDWVSLGGGK